MRKKKRERHRYMWMNEKSEISEQAIENEMRRMLGLFLWQWCMTACLDCQHSAANA